MAEHLPFNPDGSTQRAIAALVETHGGAAILRAMAEHYERKSRAEPFHKAPGHAEKWSYFSAACTYARQKFLTY